MRSAGRGAAWVLVWAVLGLSSSAWAQGGGEPPKGEPAGEKDDARAKAAENLYTIASAAFQEGRYKEALEKLLQVYDLDPNPVLLYNIGRCHEELGKLAEAADFFQRAVADPALPEELQKQIGLRLPRVLPALKLREANNVVRGLVAVGMRQGEDRSVTAFKERNQRQEPTSHEPNPILLWSGVGAGAVGLGLLGGGALVDAGLGDSISELQQTQTRRDQARTEELQGEIEDGQTTATILYVSGGALLVTGGVLVGVALLGGGEEAPAQEAPPLQGWRLLPWVGPTQAGLGVVGGF
jgi:tetratricopeptide (TPR) repeat protein